MRDDDPIELASKAPAHPTPEAPSAALRNALAWWSAHRIDGTIPSRKALDLPFGLRERLPMTFLVAPGPNGPTVTIYGTRLVEIDGQDRTGSPIHALPNGMFPDAAPLILGLLHGGVAPRLSRGRFQPRANPRRQFALDTCYMPIRRSDGTAAGEREVLGIAAVGQEIPGQHRPWA